MYIAAPAVITVQMMILDIHCAKPFALRADCPVITTNKYVKFDRVSHVVFPFPAAGADFNGKSTKNRSASFAPSPVDSALRTDHSNTYFFRILRTYDLPYCMRSAMMQIQHAYQVSYPPPDSANV